MVWIDFAKTGIGNLWHEREGLTNAIGNDTLLLIGNTLWMDVTYAILRKMK